VANETRSVTVRLSMDTAQAIAKSREFGTEMERAMTRAEKSTGKSTAAMDTLASKAGQVAVAATGLLVATGKAAMDWESQWAGVEKTVDGTASQMGALEGELRGLATTLPATHAEIAAVAEAAGQLGIEREGITEFTRTMIDLSETTNLTADQAATSIAQISNVMGTTTGEVDNFGAALVALGNDGASTEAQIVAMAQRIAGAGAQIGLAESDILAIANAASSMGIEAEAGGSAISRVFTDMAKATKQGGEDLDTFADVAGMSAKEFATAFEADPARAFASFTAGLAEINAAGGDVFTTLDNLGLSDVRVSQALLSMSAAGDLLTDSLDLGARAWEENTALALEAAKRYDTTASQVQVSWNNIKDAGIEAGEALLPLIETVASTVSTLAQAFGELPQPVQSSATGLLGITAILGGGLWFGTKIVSGVVETRTALADLATESPRTARGLRTVATAATAVGISLAAIEIADALKGGPEASTGMQRLTEDLLDLAEAGTTAGLSKEFDDLAGAIGTVDAVSGGMKGKLADLVALGEKTGAGGVVGLFFDGPSKGIEEKRQQLEALDGALTNLVSTGNAETAAKALENLGEAQGLSAGQMEALLGLLPEYDEALKGVDNATRLNGESSRQTASALAGEAQARQDNLDAMREERDEKLRSLNADVSYQAAILDSRDALKENGNTLNETTREGQANRRAMYDLAASWNDLSDAAQNTPGAYKAAISTFADVYGHLFKNRKAAQDYARELYEVPSSVQTQMHLENVAKVRADIYGIGSLLDSVSRDRVVVIRAVGAIGSILGREDGGEVPGQRYPYGDRTLILAAPGEEIITNRNGEADQFRADRAAGRIPAYADGGTVAGVQALAAGGTVRSIGNLGTAGLRRELSLSEKAVERERKQRDALRDKMTDLSSTIADKFTSDLFGGNAWSNADPLSVARGDVTDARAYSRARAKVSKNIKGDALDMVLAEATTADLEQLAARSSGYQRSLNWTLNKRESVRTFAGTAGAAAAHGKTYAAQQAQYRRENAHHARVDKRLQSLEKAMKQVGADVGSALNKGSATAARKAR